MPNWPCRPVTQANWADLEALFEARGGPHPCWCSVWRLRGKAARTAKKADKKAYLCELVHAGTPVGLLAYGPEGPVGWCSVAPRSTHKPSMAPAQPGDDAAQVWSVTCFFVPRALRGQGVMAALLAAAAEYAQASGATVLEGYPVQPDTTSYRFGGYLPTFIQAGYRIVGTAGTRRTVVRRPLG